MIEALREKLQAEVKALNHELHVTLPQTLKKALELAPRCQRIASASGRE